VTLATLEARRWTAVLVATLAFAGGVATSGSSWLWAAMAATGAGTVALAWRADRRGLAALLRLDLRSIATGLAAGLVMVAATYLLYPTGIAAFPGLDLRVAQLYRPLEAPPGPLVALPVLLLAVVAEELIWRGLLFDSLTTRLRAAPRVVAGALLYALPQVASGSAIVIAVALVCGLVWGAERVRTGGLTVPLLTHAVWSATVFALAPLGR
jgi:uncharacterized protein